jgi:hypothetical protein
MTHQLTALCRLERDAMKSVLVRLRSRISVCSEYFDPMPKLDIQPTLADSESLARAQAPL